MTGEVLNRQLVCAVANTAEVSTVTKLSVSNTGIQKVSKCSSFLQCIFAEVSKALLMLTFLVRSNSWTSCRDLDD